MILFVHSSKCSHNNSFARYSFGPHGIRIILRFSTPLQQSILVENSGNLDLVAFIKKSDQFFKEDIISQTFDYSNLKIEEDGIIYKTIKAKHIIFCEGHLVKHNPFFNWIPLKPAKGEIITIQTNELNFKNKILNKNGL